MASGDVILRKTGATVNEREIDPTGDYTTVDTITLNTGTIAVPLGRAAGQYDRESYSDSQPWVLVINRSVPSNVQNYVAPGTPDPLPPLFSFNKKYTITITEE